MPANTLLVELFAVQGIPELDRLKSKLEETLDKHFGTAEFGIDYHQLQPGELSTAFATVHFDVPGMYQKLQRFLSMAPREVQEEFRRLVRSYNDELHSAKRAAKEPWRRGF